MPQLAQTGQFCPNPDCDRFNNTEDHALIKHAKTKQGKQRYRCKACGKTFSENKGTIFYGKQKKPEVIIETLLLIAEGTGIRATARIKGLHPETVLNWLKAAAAHAEEIEHILLEDYRVDRAQIDGLWSYVGKKRPKPTRRPGWDKAPAGAAR